MGVGGMAPHFNFRTKQSPTVLVSNIRDIAFYGCSEIIRTKNFTVFAVYATIFGQFTVAFHFSNYTGEIDCFRKAPILNAGPSSKFVIVDHLKENQNE